MVIIGVIGLFSDSAKRSQEEASDSKRDHSVFATKKIEDVDNNIH